MDAFKAVADTYTRSAFLLGISSGWLLYDVRPDRLEESALSVAGSNGRRAMP
jgi:hypothetical protein